MRMQGNHPKSSCKFPLLYNKMRDGRTRVSSAFVQKSNAPTACHSLFLFRPVQMRALGNLGAALSFEFEFPPRVTLHGWTFINRACQIYKIDDAPQRVCCNILSIVSIYLSVRRIYQSSKIHGREQFSFTGAAAHIFIWLGQLGSSSLLLILLLSSSLPLAVAMMMKGFNLENSHNSGFLMMTKASFDENALSYIIYTCNNISYILYYYCCFWHNHAIANPPSGNKPTGYIHTLLPSLYNDAHKVNIYNIQLL